MTLHVVLLHDSSQVMQKVMNLPYPPRLVFLCEISLFTFVDRLIFRVLGPRSGQGISGEGRPDSGDGKSRRRFIHAWELRPAVSLETIPRRAGGQWRSMLLFMTRPRSGTSFVRRLCTGDALQLSKLFRNETTEDRNR